MSTVAETIVKTLEKSGVKRVYGIPGDSLNGFTDALRTSPIEWVHVRHEEAAAFAATADADLTGNLTVCAGSCGPGNLHLINGLYDAYRTRVPMLAIAAHIPSEEVGSNYFQETHPQSIFAECAVYVENVTSVEQMPRILNIAMRTAIAEQGPAVVIISGDVALAKANDKPVSAILPAHSITVPVDAQLDEAAQILNDGKKVTILAGAGCEGAHEELVSLAETLQAPIVHTLRGKEFIEYDNPFDVGMTGLLGFASGYRAMESCDTLLILGSDFPYQQFYPEHAKIIQLDIRGANLGRRTRIDLGLVGSVKDTLGPLSTRLEQKGSSEHLKSAVDHYAKTRRKLDELATPRKGDAPLHPQYVARVLDELASDDAVFIPDVGSPVVWAARYLTMNGKRRLIGSFNHGTMANALSQSVGAQTINDRRQIVAMCGDGGLAMLLGELLTLIQNKLPVKIVVFNNSSLNFVELEMKAAGFVTYGTGLDDTNFAAIANSMGIKGIRVDASADLPGALKEAFDYDGPALVDVRTERQELSMPPSISREQAKGFALYALRTVMSGRGDELVDLLKSNARQIF